MPGTPTDPFEILGAPHSAAATVAHRVLRPLLERTLCLDAVRRVYENAQQNSRDRFCDAVLGALAIGVGTDRADLDLIPTCGPLVIAANHPHGALDGLALASIVSRTRMDVRLLANHLLARIPEMGDLCFFVDPFDGPTAISRSRAGLRAAYLWLRQGKALIVFPAGEVAHRRGSNGVRRDGPWKSTVGRLALATGAAVLPAFIGGRNSHVFYVAGRLHPALRTALLARELLKKRGSRISVRFGQVLRRQDFAAESSDPLTLTARVRDAVDRLEMPDAAPQYARRWFLGSVRADVETTASHIAPPISRSQLESEISVLPAETRLVASGGFQVFCIERADAPSVVREIGRLRELTYRAVGEGTGRLSDLDAFDTHYLHLFLWDSRARTIVGAYRLGRTDRIVAAHGLTSLYTHTLFRYDARLLASLPPALELGRSFVREEYQKNYNALLLLWKGIGRFITQHPQYRVLFGPVTISARYSSSSHQLLMAFLHQNHRHHELSALVEAWHPPNFQSERPAARPVPASIEEVDRFVTASEPDGKGVPVLLRQYLKLNARVLGFNIDPAFGDALDALMMVDLLHVQPALLTRYLGRDEAAQFLARHRATASNAAA